MTSEQAVPFPHYTALHSISGQEGKERGRSGLYVFLLFSQKGENLSNFLSVDKLTAPQSLSVNPLSPVLVCNHHS